MADTLLIHYQPDQPDQARWAFVNQQGISGSISHGPISELGDIARGHKATLLIDSSRVNITDVTIPTQNRQRQLQAIPYALEDTLADDIEELHFAAGKRQANQHIPVVTINRILLDSIHQQFNESGVFLECLSADVLALPLQDDQWTVLIDGQRALIKTAHFSGNYCDLEILAVFLQSLIKNTDKKPDTISIICTEQQAGDIQLDDITDIDISIQAIKGSPFEIFASNLGNATQLNILQGKYAPRRQSSGWLKPWKAVAAIFTAWLCLQLVFAGIEINQLRDKNTELTGLIQKEFKKANPGTKNFSNMKKRMQRKIAELKGTASSEEQQLFLNLLAAATPALSSNKKIIINGIVFRNKFVDLDLQADTLQTLESIKAKLAASTDIKIVMSTSVEKDKVKGRLRLEAQG